MTNYRKSKLIERYEDVVFELDTALISNLANNAHQKKEGHRFIVDNSGESTPFEGRDKTWGRPWPRPWGRPWGRPWPTGGK